MASNEIEWYFYASGSIIFTIFHLISFFFFYQKYGSRLLQLPFKIIFFKDLSMNELEFYSKSLHDLGFLRCCLLIFDYIFVGIFQNVSYFTKTFTTFNSSELVETFKITPTIVGIFLKPISRTFDFASADCKS